MSESNPFELMSTGDGPVLRGMRQDLPDTSHVVTMGTTFVAVHDGEGRHDDTFMTTEIDGRWEPTVGAKVELREPTRFATVCDVRHVFTTGGKLETWVYLDDPDGMTHPDTPSIF